MGNFDAKLDWGHAREYVEAMWGMLQLSQSADYVIATGETCSVREFCEVAFGHVGLDYREWVKLDPSALSSCRCRGLSRGFSKARRDLQWKNQMHWKDLIVELVDADLERVQRQGQTARSPELVS